MMDHNIGNTNLENYFIDVGLKCLLGGIVVIIYIIGAYLHIKLIKTSKNDKNMTWMMDIANSIYMLCHKAHLIIIYILTYMIDDLYMYTGSWFCYSSKALAIIGNGNVSGHTFIIAVMKYVMIVHHEKVRSIGKEKTKRIFLVINVLYPIYMFCIFNIFNPNFLFIYGHISAANRCLGESEISSALDPNKTALKLHDMCKIAEPVQLWSLMKFLQLGRSIVCWFHIVLIYLFFWNILEAFFYFFVFRFMWR